MKPTTRVTVAAIAAAVAAMNLVVVFLFAPPWWATTSISLAASSVAVWQATRLTKEKRHGRHRQAEADTPDTETGRTASDIARTIWRAPIADIPNALAGRGASTPVSGPADGLERVESDMPILAHRSAHLCFDGTSHHFRSVATDSCRFGVDAEASCVQRAAQRFARHDAPSPSCLCGFYALPTDLAPTYESPAYVTLMVELSGTVIEHEKGYRAEHQRVVECQVGPCVYCGTEADLLVIRDFHMEQATCAAHKPVDEPGLVYVSIDDLALPVPVTRQGRQKQMREAR